MSFSSRCAGCAPYHASLTDASRSRNLLTMRCLERRDFVKMHQMLVYLMANHVRGEDADGSTVRRRKRTYDIKDKKVLV